MDGQINHQGRKLKSPNMNYSYYIEYFDAIQDDKAVNAINQEVCNFVFPKSNMFSEFAQCTGFCQFQLYTEYPGLLIGTGNLHDIKEDGAYKLGFTFDYVNGLPYLPGSSLKGMLRSVFPGQHKTNREEYEEYLLGVLDEIGVKNFQKDKLDELEQQIFDYQDIFLGAYPYENKERNYLASEYITPHKKLKNPNPISFVKVKANVRFQFSFLLKDSEFLSAEQKCSLFKQIILDFGVGAKTNVGFGKFSPCYIKENIKQKQMTKPFGKGKYYGKKV